MNTGRVGDVYKKEKRGINAAVHVRGGQRDTAQTVFILFLAAIVFGIGYYSSCFPDMRRLSGPSQPLLG